MAGYTPGESDELRSAVSKKNASKVKKQRSKFVKGCVKNGIDEKTANEIFDHWEAFASYGFNKSHATNYGIMAVKTAYLKYRYPVEYMTALLSAWKNDNEKCATYIAECREMGIEVLPPDVSSSGYDFTIEDRTDGKAAIRFGLGAVKNVGQAPVEEIMHGRLDNLSKTSQPFKSLNDFVQRVDLRKVSKRPLECLIKVGALDQLGDRGAMLASLDQMVNISTSHFKAKEMGQMDLFGNAMADETPLLVLQSTVLTGKNDHLDWEKELLGLYISDHPLNGLLKQVEDKISHTSNALMEGKDKDKVVVGGLVNRMRPTRTRKGEMMAFVTLTDAFGDMDLVFFPKTWENYSSLVDTGVALLVEGKLQHRDTSVSVLVDSVSLIEGGSELVDENLIQSSPYYEQTIERNLPDIRLLARYAYPPLQSEDISSSPYLELNKGEMIIDELDEDDDLDTPPWLIEPEFDESEPFRMIEAKAEYRLESLAVEKPAVAVMEVSAEYSVVTEPKEEEADSFAYIDEEEESRLPSRYLILTLPPCDSPDKSKRRLIQYHGLLSSYPGKDLFAFRLKGPKGWQIVSFPNYPIEISDSILRQLEDELGKENVVCRPYGPDMQF